MQDRSADGIPVGRRLAGYALGALLQTPLYVMLAFLVAGLAGEFFGAGAASGIRLLQTAGNATLAAASAGVFAILVLLYTLLAPRALRARIAEGESEMSRKQSAAPFGAVFADDALSTREKIAFVLTTWPGVLQASAFAFLTIAIAIGRLNF